MQMQSVLYRRCVGGSLAAMLLIAVAGCQTPATGTRPASLTTEYRTLYRHCMDSQGGQRMDAVDLFAGRLSTACARWAYRRARR